MDDKRLYQIMTVEDNERLREEYKNLPNGAWLGSWYSAPYPTMMPVVAIDGKAICIDGWDVETLTYRRCWECVPEDGVTFFHALTEPTLSVKPIYGEPDEFDTTPVWDVIGYEFY